MTPSDLCKPGEPVSAVDLEAIQARVDAATPSPWRWDSRAEILYSEGNCPVLFPTKIPPESRHLTLWATNADFTFIEAARQDIPALLAEVRRLREENVELQRQLDRACQCWCDPEGNGVPGKHLNYDSHGVCVRCLGDRPPGVAWPPAPVPADGQGEAQ